MPELALFYRCVPRLRIALVRTMSFDHFATDAIHAGQDPDQWKSGACVPPISTATTFKQKSPGQTMVGDFVQLAVRSFS